jgi:hypothetical protein
MTTQVKEWYQYLKSERRKQMINDTAIAGELELGVKDITNKANYHIDDIENISGYTLDELLDGLDYTVELSDREGILEPRFTIDTDAKAAWALDKIKGEVEECNRITQIGRDQISAIHTRIQDYEVKTSTKTSYLQSLLRNYLESDLSKAKETKTTFSYDLFNGKLKLKKPTKVFTTDGDKLVKFLKENELNQYVKVSEDPMWGELKKVVIIAGENVVTKDGVVVEGVSVSESEPQFTVEV